MKFNFIKLKLNFAHVNLDLMNIKLNLITLKVESIVEIRFRDDQSEICLHVAEISVGLKAIVCIRKMRRGSDVDQM